MADNVGYTPGTGALVAADEIAGVLHQRIKLGIGDDGTAVDVSATNPMPITASTPLAVTGGLTDAELRASPVDVTLSGIDTVNPLPVIDVNHEDLLLMLTRMLSVLARPVNYDPSLNRERVTAILESGTVTTVTTVTTCTTVTNMTNFGTGRAATEAQDNMNRTAWALVHRARIT